MILPFNPILITRMIFRTNAPTNVLIQARDKLAALSRNRCRNGNGTSGTNLTRLGYYLLRRSCIEAQLNCRLCQSGGKPGLQRNVFCRQVLFVEGKVSLDKIRILDCRTSSKPILGCLAKFSEDERIIARSRESHKIAFRPRRWRETKVYKDENISSK